MENPQEIAKSDRKTIKLWQECLRYKWSHYGFFALPDIVNSTLRGLISKAKSSGKFKTNYLGIKSLDRMGI